ncbi:MAG: SulP family inorganic anion transporter [Methylocystaceae bacterium]|nr:SulP family inorganic anion transporter [Methylocystaceae bacterium]
MGLFRNLKGDIYGGVTAAVVALPLALAFGVASGAGPLAGLWGAILVGFFASAFGGTSSQVSGPTGPMTVVMTAVLMQYSDQPLIAFSVVVMGGALQIVFGLLRLGSLISLVPYTVISGFMSGIGCIIILLQLSALVGLGGVEGGTVGVLMALPDIVKNAQLDASLAGFLSLALMIFWPAKLSKILPAPLLALIIGTGAVFFFWQDAPVIGTIPTGFPDFHLPEISYVLLKDMLGSALILALLGAIDSLLTSLIADSMSSTAHHSNKELIGQGIGNMVAGVFGAIPGAGATMRTVINIRAGGVTRLSGMIHSLVLLGIVLGFGSLAEKIPHAVLAGILLKVGWDIIDWDYLKLIRRAPKKGVIHMFLVLILTVFVDLIIAVGTGLVVASLSFVKHMSDLQVKGVRTLESANGRFSDEEADAWRQLSPVLVLYHLEGPMSFGAAKGIFNRLIDYGEAEMVLFDFSGVTYVDTTACLTFRDTLLAAKDRGKRVYVCGVEDPVQKAFAGLKVLNTVSEHDIFINRQQALQHLQGNSIPV